MSNVLTKEEILKRIDNFEFQKQQFLANANMAVGAIKALQNLLEDQEKAEGLSDLDPEKTEEKK